MNNAHVHPQLQSVIDMTGGAATNATNNTQQIASTVISCKPLRTIGDEIEALSMENSRLRSRLAFTEKLYAEIVPEKPFAWIEQENVVTDADVFHTAVVRFLELNVDAFDELLATMHKAYVESENTEAQISAKGEF
jgi:hypothetical protein